MINIEAAKRVAARIIKDHSQLKRNYARTSSAIGGQKTAGARRGWIGKVCLDHFFGSLTTEEREVVRLVLDKVWHAGHAEGQNRFEHIAKFPAVVELLSNFDECISTPKAKEPAMNETLAITVEDITLINGKPASEYTDAQLYGIIAKEEAAIENLNRIKRKPKRLEAEITRRQAAIEKLVTFLDSQV